jgi:XRE family transcriptional regulator, regulator of sulfur utilization
MATRLIKDLGMNATQARLASKLQSEHTGFVRYIQFVQYFARFVQYIKQYLFCVMCCNYLNNQPFNDNQMPSKPARSKKPRTESVKSARAKRSLEPPSVSAALAALRQQRGLSLDELSRQSGVSKSMLSQIERNQTNPTIAIVWRLANALDVDMGELIAGTAKAIAPTISLVSAHLTPTMRSPDGKCELRILGPIDLAGRFEWYELTIKPGGSLQSEPHEPGSREHLTVMSGSLRVQSGDGVKQAAAQETIRYAADVPHAITNTGKSQAVALLVVLHPPQ